MKWIITLLSLLSLNALALDVSIYNETLNKIEDPILKKAVAEKMAGEIVNNLKVENEEEEYIKKTDPIQEKTANTVQTEITPKNKRALDAPIAPGIQPRPLIEYSFGASWHMSTLEVGGKDIEFVGGFISIGAARNFKRHKYRAQVHYLGSSLDCVDDGNKRTYSSDLDSDVRFHGIGIGLSYSYFITPKLGLGFYYYSTSGETKFDHIDHDSEKTDSEIHDYGIRGDLKINSWNPYLAVGGTRYVNKVGDDYRGVSVMLGLLNFEY